MDLYVYDNSNSDMSLKSARDRLFDRVFGPFFDGSIPDIIKNEHGKPVFAPPGDNVHFNISHSGDFVVMAVGDHPVGVDVERVGRAKDHMKLAERFYYEHEVLRVKNSDYGEREFYRIWTFREAFSKLVGVGLNLFGRADIRIDYDKNRVTFEGRDYVFFEYDIAEGYFLTVCVPTGVNRPILQ